MKPNPQIGLQRMNEIGKEIGCRLNEKNKGQKRENERIK